MMKISLKQVFWLSFLAIICLLGLLIGFIYPHTVKNSLKNEIYELIELEQERIFNGKALSNESNLDFIDRSWAEHAVGHLIITKEMASFEREPVPAEVFIDMENRAFEQLERKGRYELSYHDATLFYVIDKVTTTTNEVYHISFIWDTYGEKLFSKWSASLIYLYIFVALASLIFIFWLNHYVKQPLQKLGHHFEQPANRNWQQPLKFGREGNKLFGKLSNQYEKMRQSIINNDRTETTLIQHATHDLKTPLMVIKSYAKSVKDGIFPHEGLEQTMDVIIQESNRMEKRIQDMLYYTKIHALNEKALKKEVFPFGAIAYEIEERFGLTRKDVSIVVRGERTSVYGDKELLTILLENLVENALRYALDFIEIRAEESDNRLIIQVKNNGEAIPLKEIDHIFTPFQKGNKGQHGLGLAIVKRICEIHDGYPTVSNEEDGVCFSIVLQKRNKSYNEQL